MGSLALKRVATTTAYRDLVSAFAPRPIRGPAAHNATLQVVDRLMRIKKPSKAQREFLDLLSTLVAQYEELHYPIGRVSLPRLLAHLIEAKGVSKATVARQSKVTPSIISDVLAGRRTERAEHPPSRRVFWRFLELARRRVGIETSALISYFDFDDGAEASGSADGALGLDGGLPTQPIVLTETSWHFSQRSGSIGAPLSPGAWRDYGTLDSAHRLATTLAAQRSGTYPDRLLPEVGLNISQQGAA